MAKIIALVGVLAALTGLWLLGYGPLQAQNPAYPIKEIPADWYQRADSQAIGSGITSWNMSRGETGVRCMCNNDGHGHSGFWVQDHGETFVVVKAPEGYSDTIGRTFKWKKINCLNCAD